MDMFDLGRYHCKQFHTSVHFMHFDRNVSASDARKLFLPPIVEQESQIAMPLPTKHKDWLRGWNAELLLINKEKQNEL